MKAIVVRKFGEPEEVLKLEDAADPKPGQGQVVVRLHAVGVNPVDTYIRSGLYGDNVTFPYTPGFDGAGVIEAVGSGVAHRKVGERVYVSYSISGTYAEKVLCNEFQAHPLPDGITFPQGAALGVPYGAAYRALFQKGQAAAGETVLVHGGSGAVGLAAVQLARAAGLRVIATAGSDAGRQLVREQGAHYVLDHHDPRHLEKVGEMTCGMGVGIILEMLANVNLGIDLPALAKGGRVMVVGSRGKVEIDPRNLMAREASIMGITLFNASETESLSMHAAFRAGLESGTLRPVVSQELTLAEAAKSHHMVIESSTLGKIVLIP